MVYESYSENGFLISCFFFLYTTGPLPLVVQDIIILLI